MSAIPEATPDTPCRRFRDYALTHGTQPALARKVRGIWQRITWRDYYDRARATGLALRSMGVQPGETIAILADNHPEWLYVDWGARCMGIITVGIYPTATPQYCQSVLNDSGAKVVVVENDVQLDKIVRVREACPGLNKIVIIDASGLWDIDDAQIIRFEQLMEQGEDAAATGASSFDTAIEAAQSEKVALLAYTTGTTGIPKGVRISNANLLFQMERAPSWLPLPAQSRSLSISPLAHINERLLAAFFPLALGHIVHFPEKTGTLAQDIKEVLPQLVFAPPRFWEDLHARSEIEISEAIGIGQWAYREAISTGERLANEIEVSPLLRWKHALLHSLVLINIKRRMGLSNVRHALVGAAPAPSNLLRWFASLEIPLREVYGMTEASGFCCADQLGESIPGSVGRPLSDIAIEISESGEVLLKGGNLFTGYWQQDSSTSGIDDNGWLHTGDVGSLGPDGRLTITDRLKSLMVANGGQKIAPAKIESILRTSPYIADAVTIADGRPYVTTLLLLDRESVIAFAERRLAPYTDFASLTRSEFVQQLVKEEVAKANARLSLGEQIKSFGIIPEEISAGNEALAPSMRLKRFVVEEKYCELIEAMYQ